MTDDSKNALQRGLENIQDPFSSFIRAQTTTSWFLLLATVIALWWANSEYYSTYQNLTQTSIGFSLGDYKLEASLSHIINDGFMVMFFFFLRLEIKQELLAGYGVNFCNPLSLVPAIYCSKKLAHVTQSNFSL